MTWADVGAVLVAFLVFAGLGASATCLAARTQARRREAGAIDWLDVLDAFEGTPPPRRSPMRAARAPGPFSRP
jgi:hypothetical protein